MAELSKERLEESLAKALMRSELERRTYSSLEGMLQIPHETERTFERLIVSGEVATVIENFARYGLTITQTSKLLALRERHERLVYALKYVDRFLLETGLDTEMHPSLAGTVRAALREAQEVENG